ncbi:UDP-N-acetylglucosamine 4,6-dehydratase family protein [Listeria booriae]|uniref:UDP-N-acetylglucosamine 4,6-dehydratase family protein n=1 Tax=Listeria booriae TaxID=1552123 RepID=UPI00162A9E46|nr:UDP-N-acetylglucosamine 4,6-dehydratase family protein [Listeria booriae]MBC2324171.1 polysaccharide biosynthesis protein [Listeria booriae]MBC2327820.1 polysaccharide biosynthesis protein [Listeria booriae]MCD2208032.1 polysaccharide biosynthesis protein [Listeria booriae]
MSLSKASLQNIIGRKIMVAETPSFPNELTGKSILVTGAGGTIGSEICRQIAQYAPENIILFGHGENSIYQIGKELAYKFPNQTCIKVIGDVQSKEDIARILTRYSIDIIYHAAAHKHVPLMEENPYVAISNNIIGTKNLANMADRFQIEKFIMISTDKAVAPTSVMGATKRIAETIVANKNTESNTSFSTVRFGNVLDSRGSVIPLFREQIIHGGPLTITHPEMARYFMTIEEAANLVVKASFYAAGGEIFVLDMGDEVKIVDLAERLINMMTDKPIKVIFSGIRNGEKLHEDLMEEEECAIRNEGLGIFVGQALTGNEVAIDQLIIQAPQMDDKVMRQTLLQLANQAQALIQAK